jgi:hypothetical protein
MYCIINLFEKVAASLQHGFDTAPGPLAGLSHGVPGEVDHHLHDVDHQRRVGAVGGFLNTPLTNAASVQKATLCGQASWTCSMGMGMQHAA